VPAQITNQLQGAEMMNRTGMIIAAGAMGLSMLAGGVVGATVISSAAAAAAATSSSGSAPSAATTTAATPGTFTPNEDPTHEASESAAREAQEDAGQVPNVP
jgi:TRAP-type C4-dicarboxylate transport system substrate-binding protein